MHGNPTPAELYNHVCCAENRSVLAAAAVDTRPHAEKGNFTDTFSSNSCMDGNVRNAVVHVYDDVF